MTDITERLAEIEARVEAATKGPWEVYTTRDDHMNTVGPRRRPTKYDSSDHVNLADASQGGEGGIWADADAEFIAHARTDVPWLVEQVRELQAERDTYRERWRQLMRDYEALFREREAAEAEGDRSWSAK